MVSALACPGGLIPASGAVLLTHSGTAALSLSGAGFAQGWCRGVVCWPAVGALGPAHGAPLAHPTDSDPPV